jgi:hypothetical protein
LTATDWLGSDLTKLDGWIFTTAQNVQTYYGVTLITYSSQGQVLTDTGGALFNQNILGLSTVRPKIFNSYSQYITPSDNGTVGTNNIQAWNTSNLGPYINSLLASGSNTTNLTPDMFNNVVGIAIYLLFTVILLFMCKGSFLAPLLTSPIIVGVAYVGLIQAQVIFFLAALSLILLVFTLLPRGTG